MPQAKLPQLHTWPLVKLSSWQSCDVPYERLPDQMHKLTVSGFSLRSFAGGGGWGEGKGQQEAWTGRAIIFQHTFIGVLFYIFFLRMLNFHGFQLLLWKCHEYAHDISPAISIPYGRWRAESQWRMVPFRSPWKPVAVVKSELGTSLFIAYIRSIPKWQSQLCVLLVKLLWSCSSPPLFCSMF